MRSISFVVATVLGGLSMAAAIAACSDGERPAAGGGGGTSSSTSSSSSGGVVEAGVDSAPEPDRCKPLEQQSQVVGEQEIPGDPAAPSGGALTPGLYVLNELQSYQFDTTDGGTDPPPPGPTGNYGRATMMITSQSIRFLSSKGKDPDALPADTQRVYTYRIDGTTLRLTEACAASAAPSELVFSVTERLVTFHVAPRQLEVYLRKQP